MILLTNEESNGRDPTLGWKGSVTGGIEVHSLPGSHITYIRNQVPAAAQHLRGCIETAEARVN